MKLFSHLGSGLDLISAPWIMLPVGDCLAGLVESMDIEESWSHWDGPDSARQEVSDIFCGATHQIR